MSPRRWGRLARTTVLLGLTIPACENGDGALDPTQRAPAVGLYDYDALVHRTDSTPPDTLVGQFEILAANEDSIVGVWSVDGFGDAAVRGVWNVPAYTLPAFPTSFTGSVTHRLWRAGAGTGLSCTVTYEHVEASDTFTSYLENRCSLVRQ